MGKLFDLDPDIIQVASDALDDMIDQLGQTCTLCYPVVYQDCPDCLELAPQGATGGRWLSGGHLIDRPGGCTACGGSSKLAVTPTENIVLLINWAEKDGHLQAAPGVTAPTG